MRLLFFLTLALFAAEGPQPIPHYDFQSDWTSAHRGQPDFCISHDTAKWIANCQCKDMPPVGRKDDCGRNQRPMVKAKCKTECRQRCYCEPPKKPTEKTE